MTAIPDASLRTMYFASQSRAHQNTLRARQYVKKRRYRRYKQDEASEDDKQTSSEDEQVPAPPFPHGPAREPVARYGPSRIQEEMARRPARLYSVSRMKQERSTEHKDARTSQRSHLDVLSTIMHRCLLEKDWDRAGRAWGMILRTQEAEGRFVDPLNHGRWGIGAEILLHRNPSVKPENARYSPEGFALAREYYERLILQYPVDKRHPYAVDVRSFYPAMFSLWIMEVSERSSCARAQAREKIAKQNRSSRDPSYDSSLGVYDAMSSDNASFDSTDADISPEQEVAMRQDELAHAKQIADRLEGVLSSPPFDKDGHLLRICGNVQLWVSDLLLGTITLDEDQNTDMLISQSENEQESITEQLARLQRSRQELDKGYQSFCRAEENGAEGQHATLSSIEVRSEEIAQRMKQLERLREQFLPN